MKNNSQGLPAGRAKRRATLGLVGGVLGAPWILSGESKAQAAWPVRPVRYINPYPAGGATDTLSRLFCARMSELSGQQFVVENRGGGGGDIGVEAVAKSEPDGYTLGLGGIASHAISPTLKACKMPFDAARDFTFACNFYTLPNFLVGHLGLAAGADSGAGGRANLDVCPAGAREPGAEAGFS